MFKVCATVLISAMILSAFVVGCSDDDKTTTPATPATSNPLQIADLAAIIEQAAPPEFVAPSAAPMDIDSAWLYGQSPLLNAVFGSTEPEALYSNIESFKMFMDIITSVLRVDGDGNIISGAYTDSMLVDFGDEETMLHFTATAAAMTDPTDVPTEAQEVLGTSIDVDYVVSVEVDEMPGGTVAIGVRLTDDEQTLWQWDSGMGDPNDSESRLIYASLDPTDSSFTFRGVGYCLHEDDDKFLYAFNISSEASSDFAYRMSYYSNGSGYPDFLHCVVGGGNKDEEFALKYRLFVPADTNVCDSTSMLDQVFGPEYSEGTGLISAYEDYLGDELLFDYDVLPAEMLANPWEE